MAWDFSYGAPFTKEVEERILKELKPDYIRGLTLLGGEPMEPENQEGLLSFLERVKEQYPGKDIWCYTGYVFETDILGKMLKTVPQTARILELVDVLVDGPFVEEKKDITLLFRGSSNQRLIDMKETRRMGSVVLWKKET